MTAETRAKIGNSRRGLKHSPESYLKRGAAISAAKKGKPLNDRQLRAIQATGRNRKGVKLSDETRSKMSASRTGRVFSPETREKIGASNRGQKRTPEQRAAMSVSHSGKLTPEGRAKSAEKKRQWWANLSTDDRAVFTEKRRRGAVKFYAALSPEEKRRRCAPRIQAGAAASKAMWARLTPEEKAAKLEPVWRASFIANPSSIERTVGALLDALGVTYLPQHPIGKRFVVDFFVPARSLVIECDGSYWHSLPGRPEKDAKRDEWLRAHGYAILRLAEADIKAGRVLSSLSRVVA
jgi:hypothetical protein